MTTISYHHKDKQIAVDSRTTNGFDIVVSDKENKTTKNSLGLWFFAGTTGAGREISQLVEGDRITNTDNKPNVNAFVIHGGLVYLVTLNKAGYCQWQLLDCNYTIGSGDFFALAAMDHGGSAKESVEYAMTRDIYTGGKVHVFDVK